MRASEAPRPIDRNAVAGKVKRDANDAEWDSSPSPSTVLVGDGSREFCSRTPHDGMYQLPSGDSQSAIFRPKATYVDAYKYVQTVEQAQVASRRVASRRVMVVWLLGAFNGYFFSPSPATVLCPGSRCFQGVRRRDAEDLPAHRAIQGQPSSTTPAQKASHLLDTRTSCGGR